MRQIAILALLAGLGWSFAVKADTAQAEAVIKKNGCLKCHSVSADKDGPAFKKVAAKYKGQADGAGKVQTWITKGEKHPHIKASHAEIKSVVDYILSR